MQSRLRKVIKTTTAIPLINNEASYSLEVSNQKPNNDHTNKVKAITPPSLLGIQRKMA
jgi:hypothetical protein